jgi:hypothetical protein
MNLYFERSKIGKQKRIVFSILKDVFGVFLVVKIEKSFASKEAFPLSLPP